MGLGRSSPALSSGDATRPRARRGRGGRDAGGADTRLAFSATAARTLAGRARGSPPSPGAKRFAWRAGIRVTGASNWPAVRLRSPRETGEWETGSDVRTALEGLAPEDRWLVFAHYWEDRGVQRPRAASSAVRRRPCASGCTACAAGCARRSPNEARRPGDRDGEEGRVARTVAVAEAAGGSRRGGAGGIVRSDSHRSSAVIGEEIPPKRPDQFVRSRDFRSPHRPARNVVRRVRGGALSRAGAQALRPECFTEAVRGLGGSR